MNKTIKTILYLAAGFAVFSVLGLGISKVFSTALVQDFVHGLGFFGPLFLVLGTAAAGIFVPLSSLPFLLAGLGVYGFWPTFVIYYLGNTIIAPVVDFWIARRWGRPAVARLAGKRALVEINKIAAVSGWEALLALRFFGGVLFDSVSYAVGLAETSFRTFFLITALAPIPGMLMTLFLVERGVRVSPLYLGSLIFWGYLMGILTPYFIYRLKKRAGSLG